MVSSMTGYAVKRHTEDDYCLNVEIRSLNHRYLDLLIRLPRELSVMEEKIRQIVRSRLGRGRIEVFVDWQGEGLGEKEVELDKKIARNYLDAISSLQELFKLKKTTVAAEKLIFFPEIISIKKKQCETEKVWEALSVVLEGALDSLVAQRLREGERLKTDILHRLKKTEGFVEEIKARAPLVADEYRQRLHLRLKEMLSGEIEENRFLAEIVFFAERSSIAEEIVRLEGHLTDSLRVLELSEPLGKRLDFTLQELLREINTVGSKANDCIIGRLVIEVKSELEKMREQVQNIE